MLIDKLLSHVSIRVEPFAVCLLDSGWRLRLPGPPDTEFHFVLQGRGLLRGPEGEAHPVERLPQCAACGDPALDAPGARVVVVTGPAGSGKTVAVRDWLSQEEEPTAWLSPEARHADPEHLLEALIDALDDLAVARRAGLDVHEPVGARPAGGVAGL